MVSTVIFCSATTAATVSNVNCECAQKQNGCEAPKAQSPSWWNWITGNKNGSQFHFFDLIELLHNSDKVAAVDKGEIEGENDKSNA
ncbi:hypothetical protein [Psychrosphaera algicola]|uniref:Uncharacterized protein n=1 Tax=Psychrosphaera algicola TaxID=3023714 RepID=A0ABT5FEP4_9GAMM|nr:hypothetical protein [Psychrosphaera sp. G1-22]MDC2889071.1 hypothetical protein [Psychrosphaera sp. G1-22]